MTFWQMVALFAVVLVPAVALLYSGGPPTGYFNDSGGADG